MISFIMMAKNEESRISDAISALLSQKVYDDWELVIIDDDSVDSTFEVASQFSKSDHRVKVFKNIHKGKVLGTGYGYSLSRGEYIKCIDADDVLLPEYFDEFERSLPFDAHCHSASVTDENLLSIAFYAVNFRIVTYEYRDVVENFVSIPKWSWTFSRSIADKVFPIPHEMPIEDVWMSIVIKRYAEQIKFTSQSLYLYRQHHGQDYGGMLNFSREIVLLRASRSEKIIEVLEDKCPELVDGINLEPMKEVLRLQTDQEPIFSIVRSSVPFPQKIKVLVSLHFPGIASMLTKLKWKFDYYKK